MLPGSAAGSKEEAQTTAVCVPGFHVEPLQNQGFSADMTSVERRKRNAPHTAKRQRQQRRSTARASRQNQLRNQQRRIHAARVRPAKRTASRTLRRQLRLFRRRRKD